MLNADASLHLYQRVVDGDHNDSLSLIASLIEPGQTLLDLGMGAGGLGQYLSQRFALVADGVSLNPAEAEIARTWYRQAVVADLDRDHLSTLLGTQLYDCIVCADVLEHLKQPEHVLAQCKALLKPGGRLITSVPNAGYCGLVAELIQGDFRYRPEGLLDSTHLRFFTRRSLQRFFDENGWASQSVKTTQRSLLASEFQVAFDSLPPAVARHLLASPDALTYQFISVLEPADSAGPSVVGDVVADGLDAKTIAPAHALYSAELYLATQGLFDETRKLVTPGRIGDPRQTLSFEIPPNSESYSHIRFDPADRPGFFRLHHLLIKLPDGALVWQWQAGQDPLATLINAPHQYLQVSAPWDKSGGALLLLHGDDPWIELPLESDVLEQISQNGARLEACAGWPMSADYLQASTEINDIQAAHQQTSLLLRQEVQRLDVQNAQLKSVQVELEAQVRNLGFVASEAQSSLGHAMLEAQNEKQSLILELRTAQRERNLHLGNFNQIALHLQSIEKSRLFRATRPISNMKLRLDRLMGRAPRTNYLQQPTPQVLPVPVPHHPVDIIVPVYRGLEDTRRCLESVLAAPCQTAWRLIVINDCSPELEVTQYLREFALRDTRIELLENAENLGFVATVNRGMTLSSENDVLLLNSDTEVANDWLDRIQRAACSAPRVASVTPFSNNATICSYPRFCEANDLPVGHDTASLDRLFALHLAEQTVEVPTGVGFCMYIRRQCLEEVGLFDVENFGKGYGEENDFCVRAQQAGWTNLHALDVFVRHAGGVSFGDTKSARELLAMETIRRLHPRYESDVHTYVQNDPARQARLNIDIARITTSGQPVILNVMHSREGGTLRHIQELSLQKGGQATFLRLAPVPGGVELRLEGLQEAFVLHIALPTEHPRLLQTLRQLNVCHIHYHHLLGHSADITALPDQLGVTHDFTAHDYYSYCPQISLTDHLDRYCGEQGIEQCRQCLQRNPAPGGESIENWRARHGHLLNQARYVIVPSVDTGQRMQRYAPTARIKVVPHATLASLAAKNPKPAPLARASDQPLRIVVLGALGKIKGADLLEAVATLAARQNSPIEFHLLGYAYRSLRTQPKARLTVHGGYEETDLPLLLEWLQPDAVWFPAQCPETYSYTLSASLAMGLPVIAPNLGSFPARLSGREWTWICSWDQTAEQWLQQLVNIGTNHFQIGVAPPIPFLPAEGRSAEIDQQFYARTYIDGLDGSRINTAEEASNLARDFFVAPTRAPQRAASIKNTALNALVHLRSMHMLSLVVRQLPAPLQRRIKSWLQS